MKVICLLYLIYFINYVTSQLPINNTALAKCFWIFNSTNIFDIHGLQRSTSALVYFNI